MTAQLTGDELSKFYVQGSLRVDALREVDLALSPGEIVAVVGPSGSGKTTLLNCLAGWEQPDEGQVLWGQEPCDPNSLTWAQLAIVPQSLGLLFELSVEENIRLPARLGGSRGEMAEELMNSLGLAHLADRSPVETSLGEQQRTALARALLLSPAVVMADEPTGHQDSAWAKRVLEALRVATAQGSACLIATHHRATVDYADRVVVLRDGQVRPSEELDQILPRDEL